MKTTETKDKAPRRASVGTTRAPLNETNGSATKRVSPRDRLLANAATMFAERGMEGVTIRQIADAAHVQLPAIYRNFTDKHALYIDACSLVLGQKAAKYEIQLETSDAPERKMLRFVHTLYGDLLEDDRFSRLLIRELLGHDRTDITALASRYFRRQFDLVVQCCELLGLGSESERVAYMIYILAVGHVQFTPLGQAIPVRRLQWDDPLSMARLILTTLIPSTNWSRVRTG